VKPVLCRAVRDVDGCGGRYFEGGVSSVYLWDLDPGFAGVILIKKAGDGSNKIKGCWDSIHVVEVQVCCFIIDLQQAPYVAERSYHSSHLN